MLSTPQVVSLALGVVGGASVGVVSAVTTLAMVHAVNAKLPAEARFAEFGWYLGKTQRLFREYRRLYPSGTLYRRQMQLLFTGLGCVILAAVGLGFGLPAALMGGGLAWAWRVLYVRGTEPS